MAESFGARVGKFMGWASPEEYADPLEDFALEEPAEPGDSEPAPRKTTASVTELRVAPQPQPADDLSRIVTVHPGSYNDALPIGEAFRSGVPVIINLTDMNEAEARRVIDFAAGLTFGLHGVIERVTNRVFLLSPRSVQVSGDITGSRQGTLFNQG